MSSPHRGASARLTMIAAVLALAAASIAYRLLVLSELQHTSLVFIGVPAILAIVTLRVQPRTAWGSVQKTVALALCLSGVVFGEALICILMAAPLFFLIAAIVVKLSRPSAPSARHASRPVAADISRCSCSCR